MGGVLDAQGRPQRDKHLVCVCVREREGLALQALSPILALNGLAHTAFGIRGGEVCVILVLDLVAGCVLLLY